MNNLARSGRILTFLFFLLSANPTYLLCASEHTAHLELKKTAISGQKIRPYVVKEGEWLFDILKTQLGITSHRFTLIKKFNPQIKDINKVYPGQVLFLPEQAPNQNLKAEDASTFAYTAKKGDSLSSIALRELNAQSFNMVKTLKLISKLNPGIKNLNRIHPGQTLQLPHRSILLTKQDANGSQNELPDTKTDTENASKLHQDRLDIIRHIISRMNGSFMTTGQYFIPIPQTGQVTIDCSTIPVAEFDDGSAVLIDFIDKIPDSLKKVIHKKWQNYRFVKIHHNEAIISILQKVIDASNAYTMTKATKPFTVGKNPPVQFNLDWIISKKDSSNDMPYFHGLIFASDRSQLLPNPMVSYAASNGLIISEIINGHGVMSASHSPYTAPDILSLNAATGKELSYNLLSSLGYSPAKDVQVKIFNALKDGFDLSIPADLLIKKGERYAMLHFKQLPRQFIDDLKNKGIDVNFLEESSSKKLTIEQTLHAVYIPYTADNFLFSSSGNIGHPRGIIRLTAYKVAYNNGFLYLVDFDMDRKIYGLLHQKWEVKIVKY